MNEENEVISQETEELSDGVDETEALREELSRVRAENGYLMRKCVCSELGVPADMTEDVIRLGEFYAERDKEDFEEAARKVYGRLCSKNLTTGVMADRKSGEHDALRKAFGLH